MVQTCVESNKYSVAVAHVPANIRVEQESIRPFRVCYQHYLKRHRLRVCVGVSESLCVRGQSMNVCVRVCVCVCVCVCACVRVCVCVCLVLIFE